MTEQAVLILHSVFFGFLNVLIAVHDRRYINMLIGCGCFVAPLAVLSMQAGVWK